MDHSRHEDVAVSKAARLREIEERYAHRPDMNVGVQALFNADLYTIAPGWAPRQDWIVMSPMEIVHVQ